jgi:hypothetical protein
MPREARGSGSREDVALEEVVRNVDAYEQSKLASPPVVFYAGASNPCRRGLELQNQDGHYHGEHGV